MDIDLIQNTGDIKVFGNNSVNFCWNFDADITCIKINFCLTQLNTIGLMHFYQKLWQNRYVLLLNQGGILNNNYFICTIIKFGIGYYDSGHSHNEKRINSEIAYYNQL